MFDAIVAKTEPPTTERPLMPFISGTGDHELVYDVSIIDFVIEISLNIDSMLNIAQRQVEG